MPLPTAIQAEDAVAEKVLKRAELGKIARCLQNRIALAHFKTKHGWEDLALDKIEPKYEEEIRRKRLADGDIFSDSSSSNSDLIYPSSRTLMSSPLHKSQLFSDAVGSSNGSSVHGRRKRSYLMSFDDSLSSPTKRFRSSPSNHRSSFSTFGAGGSLGGREVTSWRYGQMTQSSPIKPRQPHFTTSTGPNLSFFNSSNRTLGAPVSSATFIAPDEEDEDVARSFQIAAADRSSPPSTPPPRTRASTRRTRANNKQVVPGSDDTIDYVEPTTKKGSKECADLLLHFATSPAPVQVARSDRVSGAMQPPSTPPHRSILGLPSAMMTTPTSNTAIFPNTPGQHFDFADFVNMTPSPAQKPWKTPLVGSLARTPRTPRSASARRRLTFDHPL